MSSGANDGRTLTDRHGRQSGAASCAASNGRDVQVTIDGERVSAVGDQRGRWRSTTPRWTRQDLAAIYKNERAGKPAAEPMVPPEDDSWMFGEDAGTIH